MTINGGTAWAAANQSYGKGSVQDQSGASQSASTDYTSMLQQATDMLLSSLDSDKSGTIDKSEFSQAAQALSEKTGKTYNDANTVFGSIDNNSDGSISADELMKALQQSKSKHAHGGHHRPKPEVLDTTAQSATTDTTQSASEESSLSKIQMALLARVMAAYSTDNAASSSTTLATA
ncbi:MAG: hypothetical protein CJD30_05790 [Sulfuricurvum sp. PD_MW2]|uniref:EF-hand domain-containing protein n=1 Tax=Sulfuricurvum sp. PD_MW2 TaxID=2027917 RepID=UPI000C05FE06|nr:EF-hand domain-containing protein [Sulfuricurvum sp. PD_MW2]PHM17564.1 MAG: hypothetical protein CJD30_05790 [Sulfuricurvum sp. PD_MW2]